MIERYLGKISGPLLDRIAIHVFVRPVELSAFFSDGARETSAELRSQVTEARERQRRRALKERTGGASLVASGGSNGTHTGSGDAGFVFLNARLSESLVKKYCRLDDTGNDLLVRAQKQLRVSARGRGHLLRVARTIADLEGSDSIKAAHVAEAVQYGVREAKG